MSRMNIESINVFLKLNQNNYIKIMTVQHNHNGPSHCPVMLFWLIVGGWI